MNRSFAPFFAVAFALSLARVDARLTPEQVAALPPAATHRVDFAKEIKPILEASCTKCHGRGKSKGGFSLDHRDAFLKGGDSGPAVVLGKSGESLIVELVAGVDPDNVMPQKGSKLTPIQVGLIRAWIDQGLSWDASVSFAKPDPMNLRPQVAVVPAEAPQLKHPLDRILHGYLAERKMPIPEPVDDRTFARRVYLDLQGLIPPPSELEAFLRDRGSGKRDKLVRRLLADNQRYAQHWLTFWNDALRNDYAGTGYIDGGRKQISTWLYSALATNMPYDRFVAQLIAPTKESEGFTKGIVWRGVVNASQVPPIQAAQNISQVFMGVNLKCASCHDSFINDWSLADAYGLANIYADEPLELFQCDKPTGQKAATRFIYPELGEISAGLDKPARLKRLSEVISGPKNGRLTRTIVNRLWRQFLGRGLIEPVDDMEQAAWSPAMLDWLAEDLAAHQYDLKRTMAMILTSRAYQMPSVSLGDQTEKNFIFNGPAIRRLTSEQFRDALGSMAGLWFDRGEAEFDFLAGVGGRRPASMLAKGMKPQWIWKSSGALSKAPLETVYWRRTVRLDERATVAHAVCSADNKFTLYVNGNKVGEGSDWERPRLLDLKPFLLKGENVLAIECVNTGEKDKPNPAGLLFYARIRHYMSPGNQRGEKILDFASDSSWRWSTDKSDGWERPGFEDENWKLAHVQNAADPGFPEDRRLDARMSAILSGPTQWGRIRTSMVRADPLTVALGRPNREQVITTRASSATTLQALELTNGGTLDSLIKRGAEKVLGQVRGTEELVREIYRRALGRSPSAAEASLALEMVGAPLKKEGVEDFLWSVVMLPEFQLIH